MQIRERASILSSIRRDGKKKKKERILVKFDRFEKHSNRADSCDLVGVKKIETR